MILTQNSRGSGFSMSLVVGVLILGIVLLIILFSSEVLSQTSSDMTNNAQCLTLLSNLDRYSSTGDISRIKALFDRSCAPLNVTITNEEKFISELGKCNSKAQRLIEQERFLSRNPNICIPCSELSSQRDFTINTNKLESDLEQDKFSKIEQKELSINSENKQNTLSFRITNKNIEFILTNGISMSSCNNFLNS